MTTLWEHTLALASERTRASARPQRLIASIPDRIRDLQSVELLLADGTTVRGMLHRTPGTRTLDYLNFQAEAFVAMTDVELVRGEHIEQVPFVAINKAHILRVIEAADPA